MFNRMLNENVVVFAVTMLTTIISVSLQLLLRTARILYEVKLTNLY